MCNKKGKRSEEGTNKGTETCVIRKQIKKEQENIFNKKIVITSKKGRIKEESI